MEKAASNTVMIHGSPWEREYILGQVQYCKQFEWRKQRWQPRDVLVHKKGGTRSLYVGQKYDATKIDLVKGGWTHDHCQICWWTLHETADDAEGMGYTDGRSWVCLECYEKFLATP